MGIRRLGRPTGFNFPVGLTQLTQANNSIDYLVVGGKLVDDGAADAAASARDEGDGGWGGESFLLHDERERGEARTWRATAIHECGGAAGENQCRLEVMSRKPELFAGYSVDPDVILTSCRAPRDNITLREFGTRLAPQCKFMSRCQRNPGMFYPSIFVTRYV